MPKSRPPYPAAFRQQMVELVRSGRTPGELAREFEPSAEAIRNWVAQAERDAGKRSPLVINRLNQSQFCSANTNSVLLPVDVVSSGVMRRKLAPCVMPPAGMATYWRPSTL